MKRYKHLNISKAQELEGRRVRLARDCRNAYGGMPAGTTGTVDNNQYIIDGKISFTADACKCCGFQWSVSGLRYSDLEIEQ